MIKKTYLRIKDFLKNIFTNVDVIYIAENVNWVVRWEGKQMIKELNKKDEIKGDLRSTAIGVRNKIIHFGSVNTLFRKNNILKKIHKSNKVVLTWYHIPPNDKKIKLIPEINELVHFVHTACESTKEELIKYGFSENKVIVIPLGMDLGVFMVRSKEEKNKLKKKIGIPDNKIIIGSFQKDGNGWGEGLEPKLIKGPDIFCDVIERISQNIDIHILLTGPSRGYVKKRLDSAGISYTHKYLDNYLDIVDYFNVLDLYIVASRVEGGPKAIQESWATGVPVVSTKVGMVSDIAQDGKDSLLTEIEDIDKLVKCSMEVLKNKSLSEKLISNGLKSVKDYTWDKISERYYKEIYSKLL